MDALPNFPTFFSYCLSKGADEDLAYEIIDGAYNEDTATEFITPAVINILKGRENKPLYILKREVMYELAATAKFTIQYSKKDAKDRDFRETAKQIKGLVKPYAKEYFDFLGQNWTKLYELYTA